MNKLLITTGIAALLAADLDAQNSERRQRIQREVLETQRKMRKGQLVQANVRVTVRLNNGSRLKGVVKNGRFIERLSGREFIESDKRGPDAGIRVWYYDDTNSYIFLPYHSIRNYKIGERLSDAEVAEIARRITEARRKAEVERAKIAERKRAEAARIADEKARAAKTADKAKPVAGGIGSKDAGGSRLTDEQKALLAEFPPEQGWGLDKLRSLEQRKITVRVFPNEKEQRFIDVFAQWNEAYEISQAEKEGQGAGGQPTPSGTPNPNATPSPTPTPSPLPTPKPPNLPLPGR